MGAKWLPVLELGGASAFVRTGVCEQSAAQDQAPTRMTELIPAT